VCVCVCVILLIFSSCILSILSMIRFIDKLERTCLLYSLSYFHVVLLGVVVVLFSSSSSPSFQYEEK
jgi:Na+-driven multidrug efflux pump